MTDKEKIIAYIDKLLEKYPKNYYLLMVAEFIDTLEVKKVDLEKEIREYLSTYWPNEKELHPFLGHMAKYFFELGLKAAQKGE